MDDTSASTTMDDTSASEPPAHSTSASTPLASTTASGSVSPPQRSQPQQQQPLDAPPPPGGPPTTPPTASLTLNAVSTLYHSQPAVGPSVLKPVLQVLGDRQDLDRPSRHVYSLSDGIYFMHVVLLGDGLPGEDGTVRELEPRSIVQLDEYAVRSSPLDADPLSRCLYIDSFACLRSSTSAIPIPVIGRPIPIQFAPPPLRLVPTSFWTPPLPLSSFGNAHDPSTPSAFHDASSRTTPEPAAFTRLPRLPLELQAMVIKDVLALYRADDKAARDEHKRMLKQQQQQGGGKAAGSGPPGSRSQGEKRGVKCLLGTGQSEGEERSRWALALVCHNWHTFASPDLYRSIQLSRPESCALLGAQLTGARGKTLKSWIRRAVFRNVPSSWKDPLSAFGLVFGRLGALESLKVRFEDSSEGRNAGTAVRHQAESDEDGAPGPVTWTTEPSVWELYPNLSPRIFHMHHLHTLALPMLSRFWPRCRVTSSELVFCLSHPPTTSLKFPALTLKSHHLTVLIAGDTARSDRLARFLARLTLGPIAGALSDFRCVVRCPSAQAADALDNALQEHAALGARMREKGWVVEVAFLGEGGWHTRRVGAAGRRELGPPAAWAEGDAGVATVIGDDDDDDEVVVVEGAAEVQAGAGLDQGTSDFIIT